MRDLDRKLPFLALIENAFRAEGRTVPPSMLVPKTPDADPTVSDEMPLGILPFSSVRDAYTFHSAAPDAETKAMFKRRVVVGVLVPDAAPVKQPAARRSSNQETARALLADEIERLLHAPPRQDGAEGALKRKGHDLFRVAVEDHRAGRVGSAQMNATLALLYDRENWVYKLASEVWGRQLARR